MKNFDSSISFFKTGNFPVRRKLIKFINDSPSLSINIFPLYFGNSFSPENNVAKAEFLYFINVFLDVVI